MIDMQGKWIDNRTGQSIMVRDSIIDGDEMIVLTSIGNINMSDFQNHFIKISDEEYSAASLGITPEVSGQALQQQISQNTGTNPNAFVGHPQQNKITLDTPIGNPSNNNNPSKVEIVKQPIKTSSEANTETNNSKSVSKNDELIKKVFDKHPLKPEISFSINFDEWPISELKMLVKIFDVEIDEIAEYVTFEIFNNLILKDKINDYLKNNL